jgi:3-phenylpropionate/trans-cinnamate dioxygenase ferredoxin reductase component
MAATEVFVIVGGGQAGAWAAKNLRQQGFSGRLLLLCEEQHPPYERPPLSKQVLVGDAPPASTYLFPTDAYSGWDVELNLGTRATSVDLAAQRVQLADGGSLHYHRLLLTTGAYPRKFPGASGTNVFYLRSIDDAVAIRPCLRPDAHVLIIGGGWIGLEVAAAARKFGASVTVVEATDRLCARAAPKQLSDLLLKLHRDHGVDVRLKTQVTDLEGKGLVERARFSDGAFLNVSALVVGIGVVPATQLAERAGLLIENGISVDSRLQTSAPSVFAAGDVANFPAASGIRTRLESWDNAQKQGIAAATAMLEKEIELDRYPWFWSDQFNMNIQLIGNFSDFDESLQLPESSPGASISLYLRGGAVAGATAINAGREIRLLKRLLEAGQPLNPHAIAKSGKSFGEALRS